MVIVGDRGMITSGRIKAGKFQGAADALRRAKGNS
jgi:hypothetical protein